MKKNNNKLERNTNLPVSNVSIIILSKLQLKKNGMVQELSTRFEYKFKNLLVREDMAVVINNNITKLVGNQCFQKNAIPYNREKQVINVPLLCK